MAAGPLYTIELNPTFVRDLIALIAFSAVCSLGIGALFWFTIEPYAGVGVGVLFLLVGIALSADLSPTYYVRQEPKGHASELPRGSEKITLDEAWQVSERDREETRRKLDRLFRLARTPDSFGSKSDTHDSRNAP